MSVGLTRRTGGNAVWRYYLYTSLALIGLYFLLPPAPQMWVYLAFPAGSALVLAIGLWLHRPDRPLAWRILLAGQIVNSIANFVWYEYQLRQGTLPFPSIADLLFLTAYGLVLLGLAVLVRGRTQGTDRAGLLDAAIMTTGIAVLSWEFLMEPYARAQGLTWLEQGISMSYAVVDLLVLGVLLRLAFSPGVRKPAFWLLICAFASQLPADTIYGITVLNGTFEAGQPTFLGWMLGWTFIGAAVLHPSMRTLSQFHAIEEAPVTYRRLLLLGAAALIPPVMITIEVWTGDREDMSDLGFLCTLWIGLFVLVLLRMRDLMAGIAQYQRIERLKDEFISVVSHELRTPLTSMRGALGLLAGGALGELSPQSKRMVDIAASNTDRLVRLINDILDLERIESGKVTMRMETHRVEDIMGQAADEMQGMAHEANVSLIVGAHDGYVVVDRDRMVQTLTNLLNNAIKFSPRGETVWLDAESKGSEVVFKVEDRGRGIPAEQQDKIFGRFQQVDSSDSRDKGGTGLGLSVCLSIVQQHRGRIWVQSEYGKGSTFLVALPAARPPRALAQVEGGGSPLVLVCDDDPAILELARTMLERHSYRVLTASGGREAVKLALRHRPDAIVMDMLMPEMSGWETTQALKNESTTADIPVIILSVWSEEEAREAGIEVDDWLQKPVEEHSLFAALERALGAITDKPKVLLVEDDRDLAGVMVESFRRRGVHISHATTAGEAIRWCQDVVPDLLILDLMLPDGDGSSVVGWLRNQEGMGAIPVVVYTAKDLDDDDRKRLVLGETRFLTKGRISTGEFERLVMELLEKVTATPARDVMTRQQ